MRLIEAFRACWLIASIGTILFICGTIVLYWNEGQAVNTLISLNEALENAVTLDPNKDFDYNFDGQIVHITGPIQCGEPLTEPDYNIQIMAVKLKRRVQMYQWVEETVEHNYGESVASVQTEHRTYYYTKEWRDNLVDSRSFYIRTGHQNPDRFPIESGIQVTEAVFIGKYELSSDIKQKFNKFIELTSDTRPEDPEIKLHSGIYYHTNDVFHPEIGDIRILFTFAGMEGDFYTVVGKLLNNKIVPYKTNRGTDLLLLYPGELSLNEVLKLEHHTQRLNTWGIRLLGWILVFFGVTCTSRLLYIILSEINFLSALAPDPEYPFGGNVLISFSLTLIIASVAWILHRPMIGAGLLFAAASPFMWCWRNVISYQRVLI